MTTIARHQYTTEVDGKKIAHAYKAFAEPHQPWCVIAWALPGSPSFTLDATPTVGQDDEEAENYNRDQAIKWVDLLTELIVPGEHADHVHTKTTPAPKVPRVVDRLTDSEKDATWVNRLGKQLFFNGDNWREQVGDREPYIWANSIARPHFNAPYTEVIV